MLTTSPSPTDPAGCCQYSSYNNPDGGMWVDKRLALDAEDDNARTLRG